MRGYGDSDKPSGQSAYKITNMVEDLKCLIEALGYKKCVLVAHDWGALIGWEFIGHHMELISKYVLLAAPSFEVFSKVGLSEMEQFRKSWYVYFYQMPLLPEFVFMLRDYDVFKRVNELNDTFTEEDLEAYKYTFSQPGI